MGCQFQISRSRDASCLDSQASAWSLLTGGLAPHSHHAKRLPGLNCKGPSFAFAEAPAAQ